MLSQLGLQAPGLKETDLSLGRPFGLPRQLPLVTNLLLAETSEVPCLPLSQVLAECGVWVGDTQPVPCFLICPQMEPGTNPPVPTSLW